MFELEEVTSITNRARLKVIGVGGAGGNAVNNMIAAGLEGVEFVVMNTDSQDLISSLAPIRVQLGHTLTRGLGAGADPEKGRGAALEVRDEIAGVLDGADMVFITAGMGGGTGTGAAPVIAEVAREKNILTVAVVTKPFTFEGLKRSRNAESGLKELKQHVDAIITIPNNRLLTVAKDRPFLEAFRIADDVLRQGVQGISDIIQVSGLINADFADVHAIMSGMGRAVMGTGRATGERRVESAAKQAISSPLLDDVTIDGAKGVLVNITGGPSMTLTDANEGLSLIQELADEEANIIFGAVINPDLDDEVQVTVIATGFDERRVTPKADKSAEWIRRTLASVPRGAERVLSKEYSELSLDFSPEPQINEDPLDVPTFLRQAAAKARSPLFGPRAS